MKRMTEAVMVPAEYLKKPYGRTVTPESDGTFRAEIIEFPGCIAVGDTAGDALGNLEDVAASWLEATIARGQHIPEPIENTAFSGKLVVRLPKSLHKRAARLAAQDGVSLNQFIVSSVAEQVGRSDARPLLSQWHVQNVHRNVWGFLATSSYYHQLITSFPGNQITLSSGDQGVTGLQMKRLENRSHA